MLFRFILTIVLVINYLYGYKVDGISSGITSKELEKIIYREGIIGIRNTEIGIQLNYVRNGDDNLNYHKFILGKRAQITLYFTKKSRIIYKTKVEWDILSGAFNTYGIKENKKIFVKKIKNILLKKYKHISENKFKVDKYSIVKLINGASGINLIYIDNRFIKKAKNEKKIYKNSKDKKDFKKAYNEL